MNERRRRRSATNELVVIYWRDLPAQVTATVDGEKGSWLLEERFHLAIDRAAMVADLTDADDYVREWRRESRPAEGDPAIVAQALAEQLQNEYPPERVKSIADNGGYDPESGPRDPASNDPSESEAP